MSFVTSRHARRPEVDPVAIVAAVRHVIPPERGAVALHEPEFHGNEWAYIKECLDSGWVSSAGTYVERFEHAVAAFTGAAHAVATLNGTAALHACLRLVGVRADDEVLVPALTFIATANAVSYCHALPHLVDSEVATLGMDPVKLEGYLREIAEMRGGESYNRRTGRRISAMVPMHTFGHPVSLEPLRALCERFGIALIEDAAESLGSYYRGRHTGRFGRLGALSFNGNKVITTGGGGAIITDDPELARRAKHLTTTARVAHRWSFIHDELGYNYRMPNLNAALGCAQLEQLPDFLARKRRLAERYAEAFAAARGATFVREPPECRSNYWLNSILLDCDDAAGRDAVLQALNDAGLMARPCWTLMHRLPIYEDCPRMDLQAAESIERRLINLPSSAFLAT